MTKGVWCYHWNTFVEDNYRHTHRVCDIAPELDKLAYKAQRDPTLLAAGLAIVTFVMEGTVPEDVPAFVRWPLVSDRVRYIIESNGLTGAAFYPVRLDSRLPVPIPRYWCVDCQRLEGAIDYDRSTWEPMNIKLPSGATEHRTMMIKYVLKRRAVEGWDLFRCIERDGQASPAIFCSQRFRDLFIGHGCTGLGFDRVPLSD